MPLRIYLTNRVLVEESGTVLLDERRLMGRQGRLAFAYLVGERLRAVSRDELAEELWLGTVPPSWERSLSALISKLRALLASAGIPGVALTSSFGHYQLLLPADVWIDVEAASEAIDRAETALRARAGTRMSKRARYLGHRARICSETCQCSGNYRTFPGDQLPAPHAGPRRSGQPGRGATRLRALQKPALGGARRAPVASD